jgi:hypothetical protein
VRGALVAAGLLLAVAALALAFAPRRIAVFGALCAALICLAATVMPSVLPFKWAFAGCWLSLIGTALLVYFPQPIRRWPGAALAVTANAALWAGLVASSESTVEQVILVLPVLLLVIPASLCVALSWSIAPRIVTSWLLAVALLVGAIPYLVVHPGYEPDHRE